VNYIHYSEKREGLGIAKERIVLADKYDRAEVGRRIKQLRQAQSLTVQELAKRSGVSAGYVSEVERGMSAVSVDKLMNIAEGLKVSLDSLLGENPPAAAGQAVVQIPAALSAAADQLNLSHRATLTLLQGQRSLTARRSKSDEGEWGVEEWLKFYEQVKDYLPEC
jgi:transcriptional regulator with XRE-family HTH domain